MWLEDIQKHMEREGELEGEKDMAVGGIEKGLEKPADPLLSANSSWSAQPFVSIWGIMFATSNALYRVSLKMPLK